MVFQLENYKKKEIIEQKYVDKLILYWANTQKESGLIRCFSKHLSIQ